MKSFKIYLILGGVFLLIYIIAEANRPKAVNITACRIYSQDRK
jgi:hypothetical protein